jgi:hypothetical protein
MSDSPLSAVAFQAWVVADLGSRPGIVVASTAPFRIDAGREGRSFQIRLDGMYKRYRHGEADLPAIVDEILAVLGDPSAMTRPSEPMPRLARHADVPAGAVVTACPFDPHLAVFYVRAFAHGHIPVTAADLPPGSSVDALHSAAMGRLSNLTREVSVEGKGLGAEAVLGFATGDGFDASRALLTETLLAMAPWVEGDPLVTIPTADVLMLIGDASAGFVAETEVYVRSLVERAPNPLTSTLYRLTPRGLVPR